MPTKQRQTADAIVSAFNRMDTTAIISYRSPDCMRHFHPRSLGLAPHDNAAYFRNIDSLKGIFHNFELTVSDVIEDTAARKICMWVVARADTLVGEYRNEYVWAMEFDESGDKVVGWKEFVDASMVKDFLPKLKKALMERAVAAGKGEDGGGV